MKQARPVILHISDQHAEEAAFLWLLRHNAGYRQKTAQIACMNEDPVLN